MEWLLIQALVKLLKCHHLKQDLSVLTHLRGGGKCLKSNLILMKVEPWPYIASGCQQIVLKTQKIGCQGQLHALNVMDV